MERKFEPAGYQVRVLAHGISENYLCIDSDAVSLSKTSLVQISKTKPKTPYTIITQSKDFLQLAVNKGISKVIENHLKESSEGKALFHRNGPDYDFCTPPLIWSAKVWRDLEHSVPSTQGIGFLGCD
ncbi:MAG: hypothetical protein IPM37_11345 [Hahellaceae bacterium]|nr:hypothetical protein [Hahellaceae bacterium]